MNMDMQSAIPDWLSPVAWTYITLALIATAIIAVDVYLGRRRHVSIASELVWVTSGLYLGPFAIPVYLKFGRTHAASNSTTTAAATKRATATAHSDAALAVLPGGGASAVAHLIAVPIVAAIGWTIAGLAMWPMIIVIAILATVMLAVYERHAASNADVATGRGRGLTLGAAFFAALVTVAAFDVGMVGWMLLLHFNSAMPPVSDATFWFLMQLGVVVGLVTGYPAVKWLLNRSQSVVPA
jgi:hypothetical protein